MPTDPHEICGGHLVTVKYRMLVMCSFIGIYIWREIHNNIHVFSATFLST